MIYFGRLSLSLNFYTIQYNISDINQMIFFSIFVIKLDWLHHLYWGCKKSRFLSNIMEIVQERDSYCKRLIRIIIHSLWNNTTAGWLGRTDLISLFATHLVRLVVVGRPSIKKTQGSVVSNRIMIKFGRIVPHKNKHQSRIFDLTSLSRWRPWRHFTHKRAATWWVNTKRLSAPI